MDVYANNQLIAVLKHGVSCAGIASEELEDIVVFNDQLSNQSKYIVMFDPLDGSSNIDTNISIGTIFGIYRRVSKASGACDSKDFLQPGLAQISAGYVIYGSSTMFVYATRRGVNGFTLDTEIGEFCLSHPEITCPCNGNIYSVNHGNFFNYEKHIQVYITSCQQKTKLNGGPYTNRYTGSMVADLHRTLIKGGIFLYPATSAKSEGKLRLLYECNPFAFIIEVAGGRATSGSQRILEIKPTLLHQRTPLIIGSVNMVEECLSFID